MEPIIKWTGSKRSQAKTIVDKFPKEIDTYYEPFIGSAAILIELLQRVEKGEIQCKNFVCSDINQDLIGTWNMIKHDPEYIYKQYNIFYGAFAGLSIAEKKEVYEDKKFHFNQLKKYAMYDDYYYALFFWLRRTCFNGLVRYNKNGEFNVSCHFTRDGIKPEKLKPILYKWSEYLRKYDVEFIHQSYDKITSISNTDFIYLDPPYADTNISIYLSEPFDDVKFYQWLNTMPRFMLSYNGKTQYEDDTRELNGVKYDEHLYLTSGRSSFRSYVDNTDVVNVKESLYIKNGEM